MFDPKRRECMKSIFGVMGLAALMALTGCDPDDFEPSSQVDYVLGLPDIGGSGCQSSSIHISEDGKSVEIDFNEFQIFAGGQYKSLARATCSAAVPITIPDGYMAVVLPASFDGKYKLKSNSSLKVNSETFLAGKSGQKASLELSGANQGDLELTTSEFENASISECGADTTLRLNLSLLLKSKNKQEASGVKIEGLSPKEKSVFKLKFIKC